MNIQNKVLIVKPTISMVGTTRTDEDLTEEVHENHAMREEAGSYKKQLWPAESLKAIKKPVRQMREFHKRRTVISSFGALLPSVHFEDYRSFFGSRLSEFEAAVDEFHDNYDNILDQCRAIQNGTFRLEHYPSREKIREEFSFTLSTAPMPRARDMAVEYLCEARISELQTQLEGSVARAGQDAAKQVMSRVLTRVEAIARTLGDPDSTFHDSLIENLRSLLELAPALNIADDPQVTALIHTCRDRLLVAPETLRDNRLQRRITANAAKSVASAFGAVGARKLASV